MPTARHEAPPASYNLPEEFWAEIGRIVVRWAHLEHCLQRVVWLLLGVDPSAGRRAVKDPSDMGQWVSLIVDLAALCEMVLDRAKLEALKSEKATEAAKWRNLVAHGLWAKRPDGSWIVQNIKGSHPNDVDGLSSKKRVIEPEGVLVDGGMLRAHLPTIEALIASANSLRQDVVTQLAAKQRQPSPVADWGTVLTSATNYRPRSGL
jgi:hypothetical protein